ncbi:hypothetical protein AAFF_G00134790 [Aldrovandia affinis]|uniref:Out at first protein homolog n=1 Tax=Aldrovandia affinis TaxID=143900 RepID=A0AAD7RQF0_9TELE|nr:hypothetical protein AAFF_G00134790 [Aldrovandia affinis]
MFARWILPVSVRNNRVILALILLISFGVCSELKVRVRLADGQITEETLEADSERDSITVEFKQGDGTLITFVADFKQDVKIFPVMRSSPANQWPGCDRKTHAPIRSAEERRGVEQLTMNMAVNLSRAWQLSAHIHNVCGEARESIYAGEADVKHWLDRGVEGSVFEILPPTVDVPDVQACPTLRDLWQPCACSYSLRLEWYPCLLKYCRSRDTAGKSSPYKCGIKSCSKGYRFDYYVPHRQLCLWDDET